MTHETKLRTVRIDDLDVFVREAGDPAAPAIVLLHGFPTSSHMFRDLIPPDAWAHDQALLDRPGVAEAQLALFVDYQTNVAAYDSWHAYFRDQQPRTLVVWGKNDPFFLVPGAEAYLRDLKDAELVLLDGGHFALEEHADTVAAHIKRVFGPRTGPESVGEFYERLAAGDLDGAIGLLANDVSWNDPKGFPYGGRLTDPAAVKEQVFGRILGDWAGFGVLVDRTVVSADGRTVIALGRYTGTHKATRKSLDLPFAHAWDTSGGALTRFETFTDTHTLRDAMA